MSENTVQIPQDEIQQQIRHILPNAKRGQVQQIAQIVQNYTQANFQQININHGAQGIDPQVIERFNAVLPGSGQALFELLTEQVHHRQSLEKLVITAGTQKERRGQWFAFILAAMGLGFGFKLIHDGRDYIGFAICIGVIAALSLIFIAGRAFNYYQLKANKQGLTITLQQKPRK